MKLSEAIATKSGQPALGLGLLQTVYPDATPTSLGSSKEVFSEQLIDELKEKKGVKDRQRTYSQMT